MKTSSVGKWVAVLVIIGVATSASANADEKYPPESTTVALLPVVNVSGEKVESEKIKQAENGNVAMRREFAERGFKLVDPEIVAKATADLKIDLTDEEQHRRENMYKIAKAVKTDLVAFVVITDVHQTLHTGLLSSSREGKAKLKVWLLDVKEEKPIINGATRDGKSGGGFFAGLDKGSARIVIAVANGIRDVFKDFMKPYPVLTKGKESAGRGIRPASHR